LQPSASPAKASTAGALKPLAGALKPLALAEIKSKLAAAVKEVPLPLPHWSEYGRHVTSRIDDITIVCFLSSGETNAQDGAEV